MAENDPRPGTGTVPTPTPDNAKTSDADQMKPGSSPEEVRREGDPDSIEKHRADKEKGTAKAVPIDKVDTGNDIT